MKALNATRAQYHNIRGHNSKLMIRMMMHHFQVTKKLTANVIWASQHPTMIDIDTEKVASTGMGTISNGSESSNNSNANGKEQKSDGSEVLVPEDDASFNNNEDQQDPP